MDSQTPEIPNNLHNKSFQILFPPKLLSIPRRSFLKLSAGAILGALVGKEMVEGFPKSEDALKRSLKFAQICKDISGDLVSSDKAKAEEAEKVLYFWTLCNVLELGARKMGLNLAADNMHHFLYGDGSPKDLSSEFKNILEGPNLGIRFLVSMAFSKNIESPDRTIKNLTGLHLDKVLRLVAERIKEISQASQDKPLLLSSGLTTDDWRVGVGISTYKLKFTIAPQIEVSERKMSCTLTSFEASFTDRYDWDKDFSLSQEPDHLLLSYLKSLNLGDTVFSSVVDIRNKLREIQEKYFIDGLEKDLSLLVTKGYAKEFDMFGSYRATGLNLKVNTFF